MRFAIDTGGTFTDLVIEDESGITLHKALTTPDDPVRGCLDVLRVGAAARGLSLETMLARGELLVHGTTRAINAVLTNTTARTAYLCTEGHPDTLVFREGGRRDPFNFEQVYPEPYVPRRLTFEIPGRMTVGGDEFAPLDESAVRSAATLLRGEEIEAIGVCLLWSIVNPVHELRVREILAEELPAVPVTLSHIVNPVIREYRRASSTVIDASLKPLMTSYMEDLEERLNSAGFLGRLMVVTSAGGVQAASEVAQTPIHLINSGPAMAPVAGRYFSTLDTGNSTAIVADTGGTTYDVSLVRNGRLPVTRETWIGPERLGHMTGFPSVDVKSVGAGGGSIAWLDSADLLHVGPQSASSVPGPASYGRGGLEPTMTDACVVLGYLDPGYFLGGAMTLDRDAAFAAIERRVATPLGIDVFEAAEAILRLATENMVGAIEEITINQGVDPRSATLVAGGGAAGLNSVLIGRRLGCETIVFPSAGAVLSAAGAMLSDLTKEFAATSLTTTANFDRAAVNSVLTDLIAQADEFIESAGGAGAVELYFEARYPHQVWETIVPLNGTSIDSDADVLALLTAFHELHHELYGISDRDAQIELVGWRARASSSHGTADSIVLAPVPTAEHGLASRTIYFDGYHHETPIHHVDQLSIGHRSIGPAVIESPVTTIVIDPGASFELTAAGSLLVFPVRVTEGVAP